MNAEFINIDGLELTEQQRSMHQPKKQYDVERSHINFELNLGLEQIEDAKKLADLVLGEDARYAIHDFWNRIHNGSVRADLVTKLNAVYSANQFIKRALGRPWADDMTFRKFDELSGFLIKCGLYKDIIDWLDVNRPSNIKIALMFLSVFGHLRDKVFAFKQFEYLTLVDLVKKSSRETPTAKLTREMINVLKENDDGYLRCRYYAERLPTKKSPYDTYFKFFFFHDDEPLAVVRMNIEKNGDLNPVAEYFPDGMNDDYEDMFNRAMFDSCASELNIWQLNSSMRWGSIAHSKEQVEDKQPEPQGDNKELVSADKDVLLFKFLDIQREGVEQLAVTVAGILWDNRNRNIRCRMYAGDLNITSFQLYFIWRDDKPFAKASLYTGNDGRLIPKVTYYDESVNNDFDLALIENNGIEVDVQKTVEFLYGEKS